MWWQFYTDLASANLEAQRVIALRLMKLGRGGPAAGKEARRMVSEKVVANIEAATTLATGGSVSKVLRRYRTIMRANSKRMSKPKHRR
jgi:hypothetical protein